ncbi:rRNA processing protein Ipi1, partial [Schizosaccharomyces japonicus yFS275]
KQKLKVGKSKVLPSNFTDTSYRTKALVLPTQNALATETLSVDEKTKAQFAHSLGLLKHHNSNQRKDALEKIAANLEENPDLLKVSISMIVRVTAPLILDESPQVRNLLLTFFKNQILSVEPTLLQPNINNLFLFTHSAMTHISPPIRSDSTKFFDLLLDVCTTKLDDSVLSLHWNKSLDCFGNLLGWNKDTVSTHGSVRLSKSSSNSMVRHIKTCRKLFEIGLRKDSHKEEGSMCYKFSFPYFNCLTVVHPMFNKLYTPCTFSHLSLFSTTRHELVDSPEYRWDSIVPFLPGILSFIRDSWSDYCPLVAEVRNTQEQSITCDNILVIFTLIYQFYQRSEHQKSALTKKFAKVLQKIRHDAELLKLNFGYDKKWGVVLNKIDKFDDEEAT